MKSYNHHQPAHRRVKAGAAPTPRRSPAPGDVDPKLFAAVNDVLRLVMDKQERETAELEADTATRQAKPARPAFRRLYDIRGAADQLSVSESKVWALIRTGRLKTVKVDTRTLVAACELDRFVAEEVRPG